VTRSTWKEGRKYIHGMVQFLNAGYTRDVAAIGSRSNEAALACVSHSSPVTRHVAVSLVRMVYTVKSTGREPWTTRVVKN
jgi:hypothetical protein